jgi:hypothetical protein
MKNEESSHGDVDEHGASRVSAPCCQSPSSSETRAQRFSAWADGSGLALRLSPRTIGRHLRFLFPGWLLCLAFGIVLTVGIHLGPDAIGLYETIYGHSGSCIAYWRSHSHAYCGRFSLFEEGLS